MKRRLAATVAVAVIAMAAALLLRDSVSSGRGPAEPAGGHSLWYHASDVALLSSTGRPQLVEFFHPG